MPVAKETDKWGTVSQAVDSALMDLGEDHSRFEQFLHWGLEGAKDFHIDQARQVITKQISMTPYKAIKYPKDFVGLIAIGIKSGDTVYTFTRDNSIALHHDCEDGELLPNTPNRDGEFNLDIVEDHQYIFHGCNGMDRPLFGLMVKDNGLGYFKDHPAQKEIQLDSRLPLTTKIYLEYLSDGWDPNKETLLNPVAFKQVKLYIHWMNLKYNRNVPRSHVEEARREYWDEFDRVTWRLFPLNIEDIHEVIRESTVSTIQN